MIVVIFFFAMDEFSTQLVLSLAACKFTQLCEGIKLEKKCRFYH